MKRKLFDTNALGDLEEHGAVMLAGREPGTALRVRLESCPKGGCAHIEQMAYSDTLGWYRQRAFSVPRDMIEPLARLLHMSHCLLPQPATPEPAPAGHLRLVQPDEPQPTDAGGRGGSRRLGS